MTDISKPQLQKILAERFDIDEMKRLCLQLEVNWQDVSANTRLSDFAWDLANYFERRKSLPKLIDQICNERPDLKEILNPNADQYSKGYSDLRH